MVDHRYSLLIPKENRILDILTRKKNILNYTIFTQSIGRKACFFFGSCYSYVCKLFVPIEFLKVLLGVNWFIEVMKNIFVHAQN